MSSVSPTPSDQELVAATLTERSTFGVLVDRYEAKLRRYIARLGVRNKEDQEDVLQEIFIKAYRNLNSFDPDLAFSSWIYRIAHNEAISWYRKQRVRPEGHLVAEPEELLLLVQAKEDTPEVVFDRQISAEVVNQALQKLPEKYRDVLLLRYFEGMEYEAISDVLKLPMGSVGTLLHRGKRQLAAVLKNQPGA